MAPLKDTFGEEWLEMDDDEDRCLKENETASLEAKSDTSGRFESEKKELNKAYEVENNMVKESSIQSSQLQNTDKSKEDILLVEKSLKVSEVNESKCNLERQSLKEALCKETSDLDSKGQIFMENEQMQSSKLSRKDIVTLNKRLDDGARTWARGREKRTSLIKRVMSEASFMQGQVMVSKNECVQEVMSKRECSKAKGEDSQINTSQGKRETSEENLVEVELTLKNWSNVEQKAIMEGEDMLIVCIPPWSLRNAYMHTSATESVDQPLTTLEMHPKSPGSKANFKALETIQHSPNKLSEATEAVQTVPPASQAHTKAGVSSALNGVGMHVERTRASIKTTQSKTSGMAEKLSKTCKEVQASAIPSKAKEVARRQMKTLEVIHKGEALLQREQGGRMKANAGLLEVQEVECECCGLGEECTIGYVEHVKGIFSGHWVCGLCAEAVHEERHRLGKGVPMEEAVRTHMNLCKQFSSMKKAGGPPHSPGVAHAVCHLLSRRLSDPTTPRQVPTTPIRPLLSRTSSCLPPLP